LPEGHEGREIYGEIKDPHPDKGRALGRIEEKQGRKIDKSGGHQSSLPSGEGNVRPPDDRDPGG
jgi:ferredoxin-thioredoxin reductase catalytic chain